MNVTDLNLNKKLLTELKKEILNRRNLLSKDKRRISYPFPTSFEDQATLSENDEVIDLLDMQDSNELKDINLALLRIDNGDYGICVSCGDEIPLERLKAMPFADKCIQCKDEEM